MMRRSLYYCFLLAPCHLVTLSPCHLRADGGTLRLRQRVGNYQVAVFTSPAVFRAGPVDVSVLVQDAGNGKHLPHAEVTIYLTSLDSGTLVGQPATTAAATNKLFHAAKFDLPTAGRWCVEVAIDGPGGRETVRCEVEAAAALPRVLEVWPWLAWPLGVVVLFVLHQMLVRRLRRQRQGVCGEREG